MTISKQTAADRLMSYLHRKTTLAQLVDWAEDALREGNFSEQDAPVLRNVVARLGLAGVRAFGLWWKDCETLLGELTYTAHVDIVAASR